MWISKKRFEAMERKIAALEEEQLKSIRDISDYIEKDKIMHQKIDEKLNRIPHEIIEALFKNSLNK